MSSKRRNYSGEGAQGGQAKRPGASSSSMQFINFAKADSTLAGEQTNPRDNLYMREQTQGHRASAPSIDLERLVSRREVDKANQLIARLQRAVQERQADPRARGKSLTDTMSHSVQVCKTNPQYSYVEMGKVNTAELPSRLLRPGTSEGYFCELRVQLPLPGLWPGRGSAWPPPSWPSS